MPTDQKAGWCSNCRSGSHGLCMSQKCACPDRRKHRSRPDYGSIEPEGEPAPMAITPIQARPTPIATSSKQSKATATIALVEEEPPPAPADDRRTLIQQVLDLVDDLPAGRWYRVAVMPSPRSAKSLATRLAKLDATEELKLEWRAHDLKVFVRAPQ